MTNIRPIKIFFLFIMLLSPYVINAQSCGFEKNFNIKKFNCWIKREIKRQEKKKGFSEMLKTDGNIFLVYNLSTNSYIICDSLKNHSFLKLCQLKRDLNFIKEDGDIRTGGAVFAYIVNSEFTKIIGYMEGDELGRYNRAINNDNPICLIKDGKVDYLFRCPVHFCNGEFLDMLFGVKNDAYFVIHSIKNFKDYTIRLYCIPLDFYIDNYEKLDELDLSQFE